MTKSTRSLIPDRLEEALGSRFTKYQELIARVRDAVERYVPVGATVLVGATWVTEAAGWQALNSRLAPTVKHSTNRVRKLVRMANSPLQCLDDG